MQKSKLPNGLELIVKENRAAPVVAIQVWVRVGSADELEGEHGLAHVHEHMLFKGTTRRGVGEIASTIEGVGGEINAWTSFDETVYHVTMASRDFDTGLDILADAVQHSVFDPDELGKELEVVLEEIRRGNDMPSRVMSQNLFSTTFRTHPYSRPIIGYVETVKSFTREGILEFYRRWYQPKNMTLVVVGDVETKHVIEKAKELFTRSDAADGKFVSPRKVEPSQTEPRFIAEFQEVEETHLGMAWGGVAFHHEDTAAIDVLSVLLGSGDSSRLFRRVKREKELVNECYSYAYTPKDVGIFTVGATIHGPGVLEAQDALLEEAYRLRFQPPTAAEVEKARTILLSDAVYQKETVQGIARKIGFFEVIAGGAEYEERYYEAVRKVTPERVSEVARRYLDHKHLSVSVLAPEALRSTLESSRVLEHAKEVEVRLQKEHAPVRFELGPASVAKVRLDNGATLLVRQDDAVPLVSVRAAAVGGLLLETKENNGISHMLSELLTRGTKQFSAEQISEQLDSMASGVSGVSGRNSMGMSGTFLKEHWGRGFEIFSSCLLEPAFDPQEIERERKTQLEDIAARRDSLSTVAFDLFAESLWKTHPYRLPTVGHEKSVKSLSREQLVAAYHTQLNPERLVISVVGSVDVPATIELFQRRIGVARAPAGTAAPVLPPVEAPPAERRGGSVVKQKEQAHLVLGFPGITLRDPQKWPLEVLSTVLAGQGGRLFLELRDRQSLAYSVTAFTMEGLAPGYFAAYIGTAQDKLETAERGLVKELEKVRDEGITKEELERAQRYLVGTHEIALQRASSRAGTMALNEAYGLGYDDYLRYRERIEAVTLASVRDTARNIIRFDRLVRSVVSAA
jgi:zinc protease